MAQGRGLPGRRRRRACWCEPGRDGKCWERSVQTELVPHVLKGGEDSIGSTRRSSGSTSTSAPAPSSAGSTTCPTCAPPTRSSATTARPRSTSASAGATAPLSAPSRTGSTTSSAFFLTARPDRPLAGPRPRLAARPRGGARRGVRARRGRAGPRRSSPRTAPAAIRARPGPPTHVDFLATDPADPTLRLDWLGNDEARRPPRSAPTGARAAFQPHAEPGLGRVRLARPARAPRRPAAPGGDEGRRPRLLPQHLAAQRLGPRALHAQQRHRPGDLRQAGDRPSSTSTPRPMSTPKGRPLADPPTACASIRASRAATRSTRRRWSELLNPAKRGRRCSARPRHRHRHRAEGEDPRARERSASR